MYFLRSFAITLALELAMVEYLVQGFTVHQILNKKGPHASKRHDVRLADYKDISPLNEIKVAGPIQAIENINAENSTKNKNGINSTSCVTTTPKQENKVTSETFKDIRPLKTYEINIISDKNDTSALLEGRKMIAANASVNTASANESNKVANTSNCKTNCTVTNKIIPLLETLRKMLASLDKFLTLATKNSNSNTQTTGVRTDNIYISEITTQGPILSPSKEPDIKTIADEGTPTKTSKTGISLDKISSFSSQVDSNEKHITDLIDKSLENLLRAGILTDSGEHLQPLDDVATVISQAEKKPSLYKWCLRLIKAETSDDKKAYNDVLNITSDDDPIVISHKRSKPSEEANTCNNMTTVITGDHDFIGIVKSMEKSHYLRK